MGKAEGDVYHLTEAEVSKREEKIGSKRDFQIEEGRIGGMVWMLRMLHITLASLTSTPYSPKISGLDCLNITKFPLHFCSKVARLLFLGQIVCSKVAQFHRDGYIILPDVLSEEELVLLEEIYMSLIRCCRRVFLSQYF